MDKAELARELAEEISKRLRRSRTRVPIGVSNRHAHITQAHFETLFGKGAALTKFKDLSQPGQFAGNEKIDIQGPKGAIKGVRLLGPFRPKTQIEVSWTEAVVLGIQPPVRESGDLAGSAALKLAGPLGSVEVREGLILARRHLHCSAAEAAAIGLSNGEVVRLRVGRGGERETVFEKTVVRVSDKFSLELHLDTDEANAAGARTGDPAYIV
ncbi:MAG: phosphate propanoyltransferase [Elusimicrobia bacterium]|nr:phosphate propanoyltransferase [Elusimicrobiota bacterium]